MRIAYLAFFRGGRETGIHRKVAEHAGEWTRRGETVGLFIGTGRAALDDWRALPGARSVVELPRHPALTLRAREALARDLRAWRPDVVYARHGLAYPGLVWTARRYPTVIEVNADDVAEFGATSRVRGALSRATRDALLRSASGLVFVTGDLARSTRFRSGPARRVVVANGIRLADHPPLPAPANPRPRLVFIGHPGSPWHGVDHVAELAAAEPGWDVDVVGPDAGELPAGLPNLRAHGTLTPDRYLPILAGADVAVGTLALYRKHMEEASPLKTREYLARGIPTIVGYRDTDFPGPTPFLLRIPNAPDGVRSSMAEIRAFVARSIGSRVPPGAVAHLDVGVKEEARLRFLHEVAGR